MPGETKYILEAYELNYEFGDLDFYRVIVPEVRLQPFLNYLFVSNILHSSPYKLPEEFRYEIYVASDGVADYLQRENMIEVSEETVNVRNLPERVKGDIAYRAMRRHLVFNKKFKRSSGSKLFREDKVIRNFSNLNMYQAYTLSFDMVYDKSTVFLDAARKLEFTKSLAELESEDIPVEKIEWVKIRNSITSFILQRGVRIKNINIDQAIKIASKALEYLKQTRSLGIDLNKINIDKENMFEYGLTPKSSKLREELKAHGLLLDLNGNKVLFLPKDLLVPVASTENIIKLLPYNEALEVFKGLKIPPNKRHKEIEDLLRLLSRDIKHGNLLRCTLKSSPMSIRLTSISPDDLYLNLYDKHYVENISTLAFEWDPITKLSDIRNDIFVKVYAISGYESSEKYANFIFEQLREARFTPSLDYLDINVLKNRADLLKFAEDIIKYLQSYLLNKKVILVLIVGPDNIDDITDSNLRNNAEYAFRSKGIYCWYISTRTRRKDKVNVRGILSKKLRIILKELAVRLGMMSHSLRPLEVLINDNLVEITNIVATDLTSIELEKDMLRTGVVYLMLEVSRGKYEIDTEPIYSQYGENYALAEALKKVLSREFPSPTLVYLNRARPENILEYLPSSDIEKVFSRFIIVGATKTHSYSRILKVAGEDMYTNPEMGIHYKLYESSIKIKGVTARLVRYLAITTSASVEPSDLTVRTTLFTLLFNEDYTKRNKDIERLLLNYTISLCVLNNTSTWIHSLPWPLHRVDKILKTTHRVTKNSSEILSLLSNKEAVKVF